MNKCRDFMFGKDGSQQSKRGDIIDADIHHLTNQAAITLKHNDPVAQGASRQLQERGRIRLRLGLWVPTFGGGARLPQGHEGFALSIAVSFSDEGQARVGCVSGCCDCASGGIGWCFAFRVPFAWPLHQDLHGSPQKSLIVFFANLVLDSQQFVVATFFDLFRDVVGVAFGSHRAWSLAVLEDKAVFEAEFTNDIASLLELLLGFAAETDDKVAADCRIW